MILPVFEISFFYFKDGGRGHEHWGQIGLKKLILVYLSDCLSVAFIVLVMFFSSFTHLKYLSSYLSDHSFIALSIHLFIWLFTFSSVYPFILSRIYFIARILFFHLLKSFYLFIYLLIYLRVCQSVFKACTCVYEHKHKGSKTDPKISHVM